MGKNLREPAVAGMFYEAEPERLKEMIKWTFLHKLGPGSLPKGEPGNSNTIIAAQVPHAGYIYSGPAAAHVYYALHQDTKPDTVIILGPNHTGLGLPVSVYAKGAWKTPLGVIEIDEEVAGFLLEHKGLDEDYLAHTQEHSIEVQLPFLQFVYGNSFKLVPIAMMDQSIDAAKRVAFAILDTLKQVDKRIIVLASSDMTHYESQKSAYRKDMKALDYIQALDVEGLYEYARSVDLSMCGIGPVAVVMFISKKVGASGMLLKYYTSGDITGDKAFVVGYAAVIFTKSLILRKRTTLAEKIEERPEALTPAL